MALGDLTYIYRRTPSWVSFLRLVPASAGGLSVRALRLNEMASVHCLALHPARRHRFAAFADLPSDKGRLGSTVFAQRIATSGFGIGIGLLIVGAEGYAAF